MPSSRIGVDLSGPLFDGSIDRTVKDWLDAAKRDVADMGVKELDAIVMDSTGRGTGHYQSMLMTRTISYNDVLITDPVVYGPWLEGVSSRNNSTRFKGYGLWRRTRLRLRRTFKDVAQRKLEEYYLARMGGRP
jgi:hypothetical protein